MEESLGIFDTEKAQQIIDRYWNEALMGERKNLAITSYLDIVKRDAGTGFINQVKLDVVKINQLLDQLETRWGVTVTQGVGGVVQWWHKTPLYDRDSHRFLTPDQVFSRELEASANQIKRELPDDISLFINRIENNEPERIRYGLVMSVLSAIRTGFLQDSHFREYCDNTIRKPFLEMEFKDIAGYFEDTDNLYRVLVQDCYGVGFGLRAYMRRFPQEHAELIAPEQTAHRERLAQVGNDLAAAAEKYSQVGLPMSDIGQIGEAIDQLQNELEQELGRKLTDDETSME